MRLEKDFATVISDGDIIFYNTGFYVDDGFLVILNGKNHLFTDGRYIESAVKKANARCYLIKDFPLINFLKSNGVKSVGLLYDHSSVELYLDLTSNGFEVCNVTESFNKIQKLPLKYLKNTAIRL